MDGKPRPTSGCPSVLRLPDVHKESETPSTSGEGERKFTESSLVYIIPDFPAGANFCRIFYQPILYRIHQQRKRMHCGKFVLCFAYLYLIRFFVQKKDGKAVLLTFFIRQMEQKRNHSDNCSVCQNDNCSLN